MAKSGAEAMFGRSLVIQLLMQRRGDSVLHGSFYRVSREARTYPFSESGRTAPESARAMAKLCDTRPGRHARDGLFAERLVFPVSAIGMLLLRGHCSVYSAYRK
jgi:hypothetical protein